MKVEFSKSEINVIENAICGYRQAIPSGLNPMFYHTLSYESEVSLKELADGIAKKLGID